jgi:hypothetical protein
MTSRASSIRYGQWYLLQGVGEHHVILECGLEVSLYKDKDSAGCWCFRLNGWQHWSLMNTGTTDLVEARKAALRGAAVLLRQAASQLTAALVDAGNGTPK